MILPGSIALLDTEATNSGNSQVATASAVPTRSREWAFYSQTDQGSGVLGVDGSSFTQGSGTSVSVSANATRSNDYAVALTIADASVGQSAPPSFSGFTQLETAGNFGVIAGQQLSSPGLVTANGSYSSSAPWAAGLILLSTAPGGTVAFRQAASISGAISQGTHNVTPASAFLPGSAVLVVLLAATWVNTGGALSSVTDTAGNIYYSIGSVGTVGVASPPPDGYNLTAYICPSVQAGTPTLTATVTSAQPLVFSNATLWVMEFTGVGNLGPGAGWTDLTPGGQKSSYGDFGQLLSTTNTVNVSSTTGASQYWDNVLALFETNNAIPSLTQSKLITGSSTTSFSGTLSSPTVKGDTMIVSIHYDALSQPAFTVSDSQGNVYNLVSSVYQSTPAQGTAVYAATVLASGSNTVNISSSVSATADISVIEMNGLGAPSNAGFRKGFWCELENIGSGAWTVQSQSTIDGGGSINLNQNDGIFLHYDGFNWFTERGLFVLPEATSSVLGGIELTGDLGGTATSPEVVSTHLSSPLPVNQGGTGTTSPSLVAGTNISITGSWPDQTISASSGATTLPFFTYPATSNAQIALSWTATDLGSGANKIVLWAFILPYATTVTHIGINIQSADSSSKYDFGIYNTSGALQANIGATTYTTTGLKMEPIAQSSVILQAGLYYFAWTSNALSGSPLEILGVPTQQAGNALIANGTGNPTWFPTTTASSGGALPNSITAPSVPTSTSNVFYWNGFSNQDIVPQFVLSGL